MDIQETAMTDEGRIALMGRYRLNWETIDGLRSNLGAKAGKWPCCRGSLPHIPDIAEIHP